MSKNEWAGDAISTGAGLPSNTARVAVHLVRARRKAMKIKQSELAARVGCSQATISRIESWSGPVPVDLVPAFAAVLGLSRHALRPDVYGDAE